MRDLTIEYCSPAVASCVVYIGSIAVNASTGTEIWSFGTRSSIHSSPAVADGVLYIGTTGGNFYAIGEPLSTPSTTPDLQLTVIVVVVVIVILALVFLVYRIRRKGAKSPPPV